MAADECDEVSNLQITRGLTPGLYFLSGAHRFTIARVSCSDTRYKFEVKLQALILAGGGFSRRLRLGKIDAAAVRFGKDFLKGIIRG